MLDRDGRIKPCGGAIPPRLIEDFFIPDEQIVAKINTARMISPTGRQVDIPIENGFVGMVDREHFDEFLRTARQGCRRAPLSPAPSPRSSAMRTAPMWSTATRSAARDAADHQAGDRGRWRALQRGTGRESRTATRSPMSSPITKSSKRPNRRATYDPDALRCDL